MARKPKTPFDAAKKILALIHAGNELDQIEKNHPELEEGWDFLNLKGRAVVSDALDKLAAPAY
jgi:hypothetical protein